MRKGFMHATDAVIGSILLLMFLSAIFPMPKHVNWEKTHLQKEGEDVLFSLDKIGVLGKIVAKKDSKSLDSIISALSPGVGYFAKVRGIPKKSITIGNVVGKEGVFVVQTTEGDWNGSGLPDSENNNYRKGEVFGVKFVLSDRVSNGREDFSAVNFDFNNNGAFNDTFEGYYEFNSLFSCRKNPYSNPLCDGDYYEIGPFLKINNSFALILFNASYSYNLEKNIKSIISRDLEVYFTVDTLNPKYEGLLGKDLLLVKDISLRELNNYSEAVKNFLSSGKAIIEIKNLTKEDLTIPIQKEFGFHVLNYSILGSGKRNNIFFDQKNPGNNSYYVSKFFYGFPIEVYDFTTDFNLSSSLLYKTGWNISGVVSNNNMYLVSNITLVKEKYHILLVNTSDSYNGVYFSKNSSFYKHKKYEPGDKIKLGNNSYLLESVNPLFLLPQKNYHFQDFFYRKLSGTQGILKSENYFYNLSSGNILVTLDNETKTPPEGVPESNCDLNVYPYRLGSFSINGNKYSIALTNYEFGGGLCDPDYEYISFDLNSNNIFNDSFSGIRESTYQEGDIITLNGSDYKIEPLSSGKRVLLEIQKGKEVKTINLNSKVVGGYGTVVQIPHIIFGHDDFSLIRSIIVSLNMNEEPLKTGVLGSKAIGIQYVGSINSTVYLPYLLDTVWWYL